MPFSRVLTALILLLLIGCKSTPSADSAPKTEPQLRVLGYYHSQGSWNLRDIEAQLPYLTDLNLAFINPNPDGQFMEYPGLADFIRSVQAKGVRVYLSFGGGNGPAHLATLIQPDNRAAFIESLRNFAVVNGFDGVDVDIENELITEHYPGFVAELATAIKGAGKQISAALASWNGDQIPDETIRLYDFINIMSYDKTGPWNKNNPGPHSPFEMATDDFNYYHNIRGIPAEKLLIGLPFYGYGFGGSAPESMNYATIVATYPGAEEKDQHDFADGGKLYYNGQPTIRRKTAFAIEQKAGGVMIWQIRGDAADHRSLLKAIDEVRRQP